MKRDNNLKTKEKAIGTWGNGLFDGDGPLDLVFELAQELEKQLEGLVEQYPTAETAGRIRGTIGLLMQLAPENLERTPIAGIIGKHGTTIAAGSPKAMEFFEECRGLSTEELEERTAPRSRKLSTVLGLSLKYARPAELFEQEEAQKVVQQLADRCAGILDKMIDPEVDLYDCAADHLGALGVLLLISPWHIDPKRIESWRAVLKAKHEVFLAKGTKSPSRDRRFFAAHMKKAKQAFDLAVEQANAAPSTIAR